MKFKATDKQLATVMANAVNASLPRGMGYIHYSSEKEYTAKDFLDDLKTNMCWINLDYVGGRCVKFRLTPKKDGYYEIPYDAEPSPEYQSWYLKYPTYKDLLTSGGIKV